MAEDDDVKEDMGAHAPPNTVFWQGRSHFQRWGLIGRKAGMHQTSPLGCQDTRVTVLAAMAIIRILLLPSKMKISGIIRNALNGQE